MSVRGVGETEEGVEGSMLRDDGLTSDIVAASREESVVSGTLLGRRPEVSKELSGSSGIACDAIDGDARRREVSYDSSVSAPHADSGIAGLEGVSESGSDTVDGTEGVT